MPIDVTSYVARPRMNTTNGIVLAYRLVEAAETESAAVGGVLDATQRRLLGQVVEKVEDVKLVQRDRALHKPQKLRPVVQPVTNVLVAMHGALESIARLPPETVERAKRAQQVIAIGFREGTSLVKGDAESIWVAASRFLSIVDERGLAGQIGELIGPEFLEVARRAVDGLGTALGVTKGARRLPDRAALAEALVSLGFAIARYARNLVAQLDEDDPESVARFLRLVAPLDAHRASYRSRGRAADDGGGPLTDDGGGLITPPRARRAAR